MIFCVKLAILLDNGIKLETQMVIFHFFRSIIPTLVPLQITFTPFRQLLHFSDNPTLDGNSPSPESLF